MYLRIGADKAMKWVKVARHGMKWNEWKYSDADKCDDVDVDVDDDNDINNENYVSRLCVWCVSE